MIEHSGYSGDREQLSEGWRTGVRGDAEQSERSDAVI